MEHKQRSSLAYYTVYMLKYKYPNRQKIVNIPYEIDELD